ncbi:MAG: hypothetical protein HY289_10020 [Planctomycetes bacterium]|nr:hypothetical protein [Planctomycetota bacterium]
MLTRCAQCKTTLKVREEAKGKRTRCPHCAAIFVAMENVEMKKEGFTPQEEVLDEEIPAEETREEMAPGWDMAEAPPDGDEEINDEAEEEDEVKILRREAAAEMSTAARTMLVALVLSIAALLLNIVPNVVRDAPRISQALNHEQPLKHLAPLFGACIGMVLFAILLLFVASAVRCQYNAGSRGLIITGIVMASILGLDLLFRLHPLAFFALKYAEDANRALDQTFGRDSDRSTVIINFFGIMFTTGIAAWANLLAAILAIRALLRNKVKRYYRRA